MIARVSPPALRLLYRNCAVIQALPLSTGRMPQGEIRDRPLRTAPAASMLLALRIGPGRRGRLGRERIEPGDELRDGAHHGDSQEAGRQMDGNVVRYFDKDRLRREGQK